MEYSFDSNFNTFKKNISLTEQDRKRLTGARKEIRNHIRETFQRNDLDSFDERATLLLKFMKSSNQVGFPRFMTQGSFAYRTINKPARQGQQMDLDDGVYFPLTYVADISDADFQTAAEVLRGIVYKCVSDFAQKKGWSCSLKSKCIRVTIASDAHIDLPVYSIPDEEMKTVTEAKAKAGEFSPEAATKVSSLSYSPAKNVLLATDDGWIQSDPRIIHEWVEGCRNEHGPRFIDYSRFLKAWRDYQWEKSDLSSIMIMVGIEMALSESDYKEKDNVALDLEFVVRKISMYLDENGVGIKDPAGDNKLDESLSDRKEIIGRLERFANKLNKATKNGDAKLIASEFGKRFPSDEGKKQNVVLATALGTASSAVTSAPAIRPYGSGKKCWK